MMANNESSIPFRIIWNGESQKQVQQLAALAQSQGRQQSLRLAQTLRMVERALTWVPEEWGEPTKYLRFAQLQLCTGFAEEYVVNYAIHKL
ncbi:MAG: hypothetical protein QM703_23370 [Gemmatales bacterium]